MTNQTNEEINVKGKYPPRLFRELEDGYTWDDQRLRDDPNFTEYLSLSEHQEIVAEKDKLIEFVTQNKDAVNLFLEGALDEVAEKDKEIAELKEDYRRQGELVTSQGIRLMDKLESIEELQTCGGVGILPTAK